MAFKTPDLPYGYDALEPYIDTKTMEVHHDKHHEAYTQKLNTALEGHEDWFKMDIEEVLGNLSDLPAETRTAVQNNGGGHYHHNLFWEMMAPNGGGEPVGTLKDEIYAAFDSFDQFKANFTEAAKTVFGSGWAWLVLSNKGDLEIIKTPNQDSPVSQGHKPLLGIDVWEHAYYLKYQNKRPDYIEAWWNVVNWEKAEEYFKS